MSKPGLTVVYPLDPLGPKVGGSVTFIQGLVRHAPDVFDLKFIGVSAEPSTRRPGRWTTARLGARQFQFLPLFDEIDEDRRRAIPLSLRFVAHLSRRGLPQDGSVLVHNRIETVLARSVGHHRNAVVIHNDLAGQIDSGGSEMLWSRIPRLYYAMEKRALRNIDHVFTVSSRTLDGLRNRYAGRDHRFSFVPTWVDPSMFSPATEDIRSVRARLAKFGVRLDAGAQWILFAGRLQRQKAPERLLEAYVRVRTMRPQTKLLIVGSGNLRDSVERQIEELGFGEDVCLLPPVPQQALADFYRAADVLALTSNFEGMPMGVLEALCCGTPVATTAVGEVSRVVIPGQSGEISSSFEPQDVAEAIMRVLADPGRYAPHLCTAAVVDYTPGHVLGPVFDRLHELHRTPPLRPSGA